MRRKLSVARGGPARRGAMWLVALCACLLCGCTIYRAKPLPTGTDFARAPTVTLPARALKIPGLKSEPLDLAEGLNEINVMTLAVVGNPALKAARAQSGIASAQLLAAGLLPDPQVSGGLSKSSLLTGYSVSLMEDIRALITRNSAEAAARAHLHQVNLDILWQEWQVAERAQTLYIEARMLARLHGVLNERRAVLMRLYYRDEKALSQHYVSVDSVASDFTDWDAAEAAWRAFELARNQNRHALDALLGLAPDVRLDLRGEPSRRAVSAGQYKRAVAGLPRRRPDLLALRAGYKSAQERLRKAILSQFPLISAGVQKTRSAEDGVESIGFNVSLTLPIFNRNRGPIAVGRASRAYLYHMYQARLDETTSQAAEVWKATRIMYRQLRALEVRSVKLSRAAKAAERNLRGHELSLRDYADVDANALATRAEVIRLQATLEQAQATLAMLLGLPL